MQELPPRPQTVIVPLEGPGGAADESLARPKVAVDTVLFAVEERPAQDYLVPAQRRARCEATGHFPAAWCGSASCSTMPRAASCSASTGLSDAYLEQLFTFGDPSRDPDLARRLGRLYGAYSRSGADRAPFAQICDRGQWFEVSALPPLAYDHSLMAEYALKRLKAKLEYTNIAYACCPRSLRLPSWRSFTR